MKGRFGVKTNVIVITCGLKFKYIYFSLFNILEYLKNGKNKNSIKKHNVNSYLYLFQYSEYVREKSIKVH